MSSFGERDFIERMRAQVPGPPPPHGPGDDAALEGRRVTTVDLMVEGVHFLRPHPPEWLGHKLLAVNLSDVGAMGAKPTGFVVTAALPEDTPAAWWDALSRGMGALAVDASVPLVGGDVTRSTGPVMLGITAWGVIGDAGPLLRTEARPGDLLMVHAVQGIGRSAYGLERWLRCAGEGWGADPVEAAHEPAIRAHLRPETSWTMGPWAVGQGATGGMDCSDGLLLDVEKFAVASGVGMEVDLDRLPMDPVCASASLESRIAGAEDYGLMVSVPPERRPLFEAQGFVTLGKVRVGHGVVWRQGEAIVTPSVAPFSHFGES